MHSLSLLLTFALSTAVLGSPYQTPLTCPGLKARAEPGWKKDNAQLLVPLTDKARTGLLNEAAEEGLIRAAGPRFANAFYDVDEEMGPGMLECAATITKSAICLVSAVATNKKDQVLKCASKDSLCGCISYLGKVSPMVKSFVQQTVCKNSMVEDYADSEIDPPYVEYLTLAEDSLVLQAIRGDLYKYQIDQLKDLSEQSSSTAATGICPLGFGSCGGGCRCCVGACLLGEECLGACA